MSIPVLPPYVPPFKPVPQITPFTYRDGQTYLDKLEGMVRWINFDLIPFVNDNYSELADDFEEQVNILIAAVNAAIDEVINSSIQVQDVVVAGIFDDPDSATRSVTDLIYGAKSAVDALEAAVNGRLSETSLDSRYLRKSITSFNVKDFGAIGDGVTDDSTAIAATINAATSNAQVIFPPGIYKITSPISNAGKSIDIIANGASFIKDGEFTSVVLNGTFDPFVAVTSLAVTNVTEPDGTVPGLVLGISTPVTWKRGDIVKIISNDVIPGTRDEGNGSPLQGRMGQFFTVYSVSGLVVTLTGTMIDTFASSIRVGRIAPISVSWTGGTFDVTSTHLANNYHSRTMNLVNLPNPRVNNIIIERTTSIGISVIGCYGAIVNNINVRWGYNDPANSGLGYAFANFSSQGLRLSNLYANTVRSGYTDGHAFLPVDSVDYAGYGRPLDAIISDSIVDSATNTGFGCHTSGTHTTFTNCTVMNAFIGVGLRGRENVVNGLKCVNINGAAVRIFSEDNGQSWGHTIDDISINGCTDAIELYVNDIAGTAHYQERENRSVFISNVHARNVYRYGIKAHNIKVVLNNIYLHFSGARSVSTNVFYNAHIMGMNHIYEVDDITTNNTLSIFQLGSTPASVFELESITVKGDVSRTFQKVFHNSDTQVIRCRGLRIDTYTSSSIVDAVTVGGYVDFEVTAQNERSSAHIAANTSQIVDSVYLTRLNRTRDPIINLEVALSANTVMGNMPSPGKRGAIVIIRNGSSFTLTVNNGSTSKVTTVDGANRVIAAKKSMILTAVNDTWFEVAF